MSHATVMVLGPTNEEELGGVMAPFCEEIEVDPYFDPAGDWLIGQAEDGESQQAFADRKNAEWGYASSDEQGFLFIQDGVLGSMSTYNPLSKWDWYQVGGRWRGSLPLKAGRTGIVGPSGVFDNDKMYENGADVTVLGDIDLDRMRTEAGVRAAEAWDVADAARAGRDFPTPPAEDADRDTWQAWWKHPVVSDVKEAAGSPLFLDPHDLIDMLADRDRHIQRCIAGAVPAFATLVQGEGWLEPGRMGWFGMSTDNGESRDEYYEKVNKLLDSMPPETTVWMIDYHI